MADGTIVIDTELNDSGLEKGYKEAEKSAKAQAAKLAAEYKKQGMSASEALKKAWSEIERDSKSKSEQTANNWNSSTDKIKSKISSLADSMGKLAVTGIATVSTALMGLGGYAAKVGSEFEASMSQVSATMGYSVTELNDSTSEASKNLQKLKDTAKELGSTTQFSASQAGEALNYLALAGMDADKACATLPTVLDLAAAGGMDLATASDQITDSMSSLGIEFDSEGKNVSEFADKMAVTAQKSNTSVQQLGDAILTVGGTAKVLAGGTTEMNTELGILADNGIKGAEGGTALRNVILSLTAPTDTASKAMQKLGLNALDSNGNVRPLNETFKDLNQKLSTMSDGEKTKVLNEIFNKVDLKSVNALLANSGERFDQLSEYINNSEGAAAKMAKTMNDNLKGQLTALQSALEGLGVELYESVDNPMKDVVSTANDMINKLTNAFKSGGFEGLTEELGTVFAEIVTDITNNTPKIIKTSTSIIKSFVKGLRNNSKQITQGAVEIIKTLVEAIIELAPEIISVGADIISELAEGLVESVPELEIIVGPISDIFKLISKNSKLALEGILAFKAISSISNVISITTKALAGLEFALTGIPLLPVIAGLSLVVAGVSAYNSEQEALNSTFTRSEEEMGWLQKTLLHLNGIQTKNKDELIEMGAVYADFGENIGNDFKNSVESATKEIHSFNSTLAEINLDDVLSDEETNNFTKKIDDCVNTALKTISDKQSEAQATIKDLFIADDSIIDESEQAIIELCKKEYDIEADEVKKNQDAINNIYNTARTESRKLTDDEVASIKNYYAQIKQIELQAQAENTSELEYAQVDFQNRINNLDAKGASELLTQKKKELDELKIQKENQYDVMLMQAEKSAEKLSGEERIAAEQRIEEQKTKKEEAIKLYEDQWKEYKRIVEEEAPSIAGEINEFTGEMLSNNDKKAQNSLQKLEQKFKDMSDISETGWYRLYSEADKTMHDIYVTVDSNTQEITGCWDSVNNTSGGYTKALREEAEKLGQATESTKLQFVGYSGELDGVSVANNNLVNSLYQPITALQNVEEAADGTSTAIVNINNKPIKIKFNSEGIITSMRQIGDSMDEIPGAAEETSEEIASAFQKTEDEMPSVGENIVDGIGVGIDNNKGSLFEKISSFASGLLEKAKNALGIHSPSRKFRDLVGQWIPLGIVEGIKLTTGDLLNAGVEMAESTINAIANAFDNGIIVTKTKEIADTMVQGFRSASGQFTQLQKELQEAQENYDWWNNRKVENNKWYSESKANLDSIKEKLEELKDKKEELNTQKSRLGKDEKSDKEAIEATINSLEDEIRAWEKTQKEAEKDLEYYKKVAQEEIDINKQKYQAELNEAKKHKEQLEQLIKGVTTALKNQLEQQKEAVLNNIEKEENALKNRYDKEEARIDKVTEKKKKALQEKIDALDEEKEAESRLQEIQEANNSIAVLQAKLNNTASEADKKALALKIKNSKAALEAKKKEWDRTDEKARLKEEQDDLEERAKKKKDRLKADYEEEKANLEKRKKATEEYYKTLLETDNLNAQVRYRILNDSNEQLVQLLNSYAPYWQDAGQSLADSLIYGLNSKKQDMTNAVASITQLKGSLNGYASGTRSNRIAGMYNVDEKGFELSTNTNNPVAYVSKGAGILNHMQSLQAIKAEVKEQVGVFAEKLKNAVYLDISRMGRLALVGGNTYGGNIDNSNNYNAPLLHADNITVQSDNDIESLAQELYYYGQKKRR